MTTTERKQKYKAKQKKDERINYPFTTVWRSVKECARAVGLVRLKDG